MSYMYLMLVGPLTAALLFVVMLLMIKEPNTGVNNMVLLRTLFLEHTGSPPTDEEYIIFGQLSAKEMHKIFKKLKK
tara:strand:+ start:135 stop:362 length:228 start_codon:yes stop_codon:yes gene_type:complete